MGDAVFFLKFAARQVVKGLLSQYKYGVRFNWLMRLPPSLALPLLNLFEASSPLVTGRLI